MPKLTETELWTQILGPIPRGTIVKVRNRAFKSGSYLGIVTGYNYLLWNVDGKNRIQSYIIAYLVRGQPCEMWVRPVSIIGIPKNYQKEAREFERRGVP